MRSRFSQIVPAMLVLFATAAHAQEAVPAASGQQERGFVAGVSYGSQPVTIANDEPILNFSAGGLLLGYKFDRAIAGLGFDVQRLSQTRSASTGNSSSSTPDTTKTHTTFLITPGIQVAALRSEDKRVELFAELDVGFGKSFDSTTPPPAAASGLNATTVTSNIHVLTRVGPGVRYWLHPQFALSALASLNVDYESVSSTTPLSSSLGGPMTSDTALTTTYMAGSIQLIGVF